MPHRKTHATLVGKCKPSVPAPVWERTHSQQVRESEIRIKQREREWKLQSAHLGCICVTAKLIKHSKKWPLGLVTCLPQWQTTFSQTCMHRLHSVCLLHSHTLFTFCSGTGGDKRICSLAQRFSTNNKIHLFMHS